MKLKLLLTFIFLSALIWAILNFHTQTPIIHNLDSDKLWSLVQSWRQSQGLKPYTEDQKLCPIAQIRAQEIQTDFSHNQFHRRFDNSSFAISENLIRKYAPAYTITDEQDGLRAWLESPSHLDNLKKPYLFSCLRCINNFCAQEFSNFNTEQ